MAAAKQQISGQLLETKETATTAIVGQANEVKADLQRQAEAARRQVAIAAWWSLIAFISSGSAAAGAGYVAAMY